MAVLGSQKLRMVKADLLATSFEGFCLSYAGLSKVLFLSRV
jgi:hypothetical protein